MPEKELTVRDLKRTAAKRIYDLVIAKNASLPDKGSHTDAVVDMLDAIVTYAEQRILRTLRNTLHDMNLNAHFDLAMLHNELVSHLLPEKPPEEPGVPVE